MYTDNGLRVSSAQAVTSTAVSTASYDLGVARDVGEGEPLWINVAVVATATAAGAATVDFEAIVADDAALTSNVTVVGRSEPIGKADLVADVALSGKNAKPSIAVAVDLKLGSTRKRYLGMRYTVATGPLTAGAFTADIVTGVQDRKYHASGFTVIG